jgi:hypothetical protein
MSGELMSENWFTPDTERVRKMYATYYGNNSSNFALRWAEFNRWLAEVEEEAFEKGADSIRNQCNGTPAGGGEKR